MPKTGARPGVVSCAAYAAGRRAADLHIEEVGELLEASEEGFVWIGLYEPTATSPPIITSDAWQTPSTSEWRQP